METTNSTVELTVSKWGNSLAIRLPADSAKRMGVTEGDTLIAEISPAGHLILAPERRTLDKAGIQRLRQFIAGQTETASVVESMRDDARY